MSIGEDITEVIQELGSPVTITKLDGSVVTGEYLISKNYYEQSTEFIRQNCYAASIQHNSVIEGGDILEFEGITTIVMNEKPSFFEQEQIIANLFLVETNVHGRFATITKARNTNKELVETLVYFHNTQGLQVEEIRNPVEEIKELAAESTVNETLLIPLSSVVQIPIGCVWNPSLTEENELYEVVNLNERSYKNVYKVYLRKK